MDSFKGAIITTVVERIAALLEKQILKEINLIRGVEKGIVTLSNELRTIRNVFDDADRAQYTNKTLKDWLERLEETSYQMDDVLDEWYIALQEADHRSKVKKASCFFIFPRVKKIVVKHDIAKKIKNVKQILDQILSERVRYDFIRNHPVADSHASWRVQSTSFIDVSDVCGREIDRESLIHKLTEPAAGGSENSCLQVMSIVGVGGVGKTTLAQLTYNDTRVQGFFDLKYWVSVSHSIDATEIAKVVLKDKFPKGQQLDIILDSLKAAISGKRFILVLDDIWEADLSRWETLRLILNCGGQGSKILLTTRNERVAIMLGCVEEEIHRIGVLPDEDCWLILRRIAYFGRREEEQAKLQDIGKSIASKCKGLPLAARVLGSLLRFKSSLEEWEDVMNNEIWKLEEAEVNLFPHLFLSYHELSPVLKRCFSYCGSLPKDFLISVDRLIDDWTALGYLGSGRGYGSIKLRGREYFNSLAMLSFFQKAVEDPLIDGKIEFCRMHYIVHDFARFLRENRRVDEVSPCSQACDPSLVSRVRKYRSLYLSKDEDPRLCDCLLILRVLNLRECGWKNIQLQKFIHLRRLNLESVALPEQEVHKICKLYNLQELTLRNCKVTHIPTEIGNLINLRMLGLSDNESLEELPESIGDLHELRSLNVDFCTSLSALPESIEKLVNLKDLENAVTYAIEKYPEGLGRLTGLRRFQTFKGGRDSSKFKTLKNLNRLTGSLELAIKLSPDDFEGMVEDVREAELRKKIHLQSLEIQFEDEMDDKYSLVSLDVLDALEPHSRLEELVIYGYMGPQLPDWIVSPVNQLKNVRIVKTHQLSSFPLLGKLPHLETLSLSDINGLNSVGREIMAATTTRDPVDIASSSSAPPIANAVRICFPKLTELYISDCDNWKEWVDITPEEEKDDHLLVMPCLKELDIIRCAGLTVLPHRLLNKTSLELLDLTLSPQLYQLYEDKEGPAWKSISQKNPRLQVKFIQYPTTCDSTDSSSSVE